MISERATFRTEEAEHTGDRGEQNLQRHTSSGRRPGFRTAWGILLLALLAFCISFLLIYELDAQERPLPTSDIKAEIPRIQSVINAANPLSSDWESDIALLEGYNVYADTEAIAPLYTMLKAGEAEGLSFVVCSGYRTRGKQTELYYRQVEKLILSGLDESEAKTEAAKISAPPGTSEHESGLAFDIVATAYQNLDDGYASTPEALWLRANCATYGFILRYPAGSEEETGIIYEPWHFRYVGHEVAEYITAEMITLEEYAVRKYGEDSIFSIGYSPTEASEKSS